MATLSTAARDRLPTSAFALSGRRFPIPDQPHAIAAKRLAGRSLAAGNITQPEYNRVQSRADRMLHALEGG